MNKIDIVKNLFAAIEKNNFEEAKKYLSDDFTFTGPVPKSTNGETWLKLHKMINQGVPDFSYNASGLNESGNTVNGTVKISGTHSKELPSLMTGVPSIPATNKKIQLPSEDFTITFKGDKVNKFAVEKVANGGVAGLLKQVGVSVPSFMS